MGKRSSQFKNSGLKELERRNLHVYSQRRVKQATDKLHCCASISGETLPTMQQEVGLKNFKFIFLSGGSMLKWVAFAAWYNSYNAMYLYIVQRID